MHGSKPATNTTNSASEDTMNDWTPEMDEAFNEVEKQSNLGKQILQEIKPQREWVSLTQTQVKLLWEGVQEEAIKSGDSLNWVFYTHINEALKEKNT